MGIGISGSRIAIWMIIGGTAWTMMPAARAQADACGGRLEIVNVAPVEDDRDVECDDGIDPTACKIKEALAKIKQQDLGNGKKAYVLERVKPNPFEYLKFLHPLEKSETIAEMDRLRIRAREISGHDACEPNFVYIGEKPVFGVGPAFASSELFTVNSGRTAYLTSNVTFAEDASFMGKALLSKMNLRVNSYYDIVMAHEFAHGLMQDLYGVEEFSKLEASVVSRDGHMASTVTDPALAWIEGFAEAFEAYLGERHLRPAFRGTHFLDDVAKDVVKRGRVFDMKGWGGYWKEIPGMLATSFDIFLFTDDFVGEFIKHERQQPLRDNHYVLRGNFNNLAHAYGLPTTRNPSDAADVMWWKPENGDAIYSKEGVVAHFIYRLLAEGMADEVFSLIHRIKPKDLYEFATAFRDEIGSERLAVVADVYKAIFTDRGREAVRRKLMATGDSEVPKASRQTPAVAEGIFQAELEAIGVPGVLVRPRDLWVEFHTNGLMMSRLKGGLDRINLATASADRITDLLGSFAWPVVRVNAVADTLVYVRDREIAAGRAWTVKDLADRWYMSIGQHILHRGSTARGVTPSQLLADVRLASEYLARARMCFKTGCESGGKKRY